MDPNEVMEKDIYCYMDLVGMGEEEEESVPCCIVDVSKEFG